MLRSRLEKLVESFSLHALRAVGAVRARIPLRRLLGLAPLLLVVALPVLARSSAVARIPPLEPVGRSMGKVAVAAIAESVRGLP